MFGFGEKKPPALVGAKEKLRAAQELRVKKYLAEAKAKGIGKEERSASQAVPVTLFYVLSVIFAALLTESNALARMGWHIVNNSQLNRILVGGGIPAVTGDADIDKLIVLFSRGALIFIATGIFPFVGFLLMKYLDRKVNPYTAIWGVGIIIPMIYFLFSANLDEIVNAL